MRKPPKKPRPPVDDIADRPPLPAELVVSFRYFRQEPPFVFPTDREGYGPALLERLRNLCTMSPRELQTNRSPALRSHAIDWENTSKAQGFGFNRQFTDVIVPWQFGISANEHGRIHGFWLGNVFYLVWLDPDHQLYPGE